MKLASQTFENSLMKSHAIETFCSLSTTELGKRIAQLEMTLADLYAQQVPRKASIPATPCANELGAETVTRTFNHAFALGFEISGSTTEDGSDLTADQLRSAIFLRVLDLMKSYALREAVGGAIDSHQEED